MSQDKVSRRKLLQEPDEFLSLSQRVWLWVHDNQKRAAAIAGGAVAAVLLVVAVQALVTRAHEKRAAALSTAVSAAQGSPGRAPADLAREFSSVATTYAGSREATIARFLEAGARAAAGDAEAGRRIYRELAAGKQDAGIAALSEVGLVYLDLAEGKLDAARPALEALLARQGTALPRAQLKLELAQIHEKQGRPADALRIYREVLADSPDGSWAEQATERVRALADREPAAS